AMAKGELIQFLDADDLLHPEKLERQVAELERSGADMVCCFGQCDDPTNTMDAMYRRRYDGGDAVRFVLRGVLQTSAPLHRRENVEAVGGFREDLPCSQERDLHLRLACAGLRFHQLPEVLYTVRRMAGSVSSDSVKVLDQHVKILWPAYERLRERGELSDERARAFAGLLASDARAYLRQGHADRAAKYFAEARKMHPDGGLSAAYQGPARWLRRMLGPRATERLVGMKRRMV
ncbi:MAG: glycosyltransferase, partial [Phycisphaeraceae bacterium]